MDGLMMSYQLTIPAILERAATVFGHKQVVSRRPDKSLHRSSYLELAQRAHHLAAALQQLGIQPGDRVGTLAWNHYQHLEAYFGVPLSGAVLHTLNLRLHPTDLAYIIDHAGDRVILVDATLLPLLQAVLPHIKVDKVVVMSQAGPLSNLPEGMLDYETLLAEADVAGYQPPELQERQAAAMCYTSGTTGRPKGVLYSHRAIVLHSLGGLGSDATGLKESDTVLPMVPMFHVNAWGLPFTCTMVGARQVFPGPHLDPLSLVELFEAEQVTFTAGVPTVWLGVLQMLDKNPELYDVSSLKTMLTGGQAAPEAMIRGFKERHGINVVHAWGMTETTPLGSVTYVPSEVADGDEDGCYRYLVKQGRPSPLVEIRAHGENGLVPWDGETMGELEVRGPWIAASYYDNPEGNTQFTDDGWFRTGDIVSIDPLGYIEIRDRAKDVIKSGGEWISSIALENALMAHPAVAEAAVVGAPHPKWLERPVAFVVLKEGQSATAAELRAHLEPSFARWWLPDAYQFVEAIPRTSTGKFLKTALREQAQQVEVQTLERAD